MGITLRGQASSMMMGGPASSMMMGGPASSMAGFITLVMWPRQLDDGWPGQLDGRVYHARYVAAPA